jgi:hypothetical protein
MAMKANKLPQTDSIQELARFWDKHELTDFEDELEEVTEPAFAADDSGEPERGVATDGEDGHR